MSFVKRMESVITSQLLEPSAKWGCCKEDKTIVDTERTMMIDVALRKNF